MARKPTPKREAMAEGQRIANETGHMVPMYSRRDDEATYRFGARDWHAGEPENCDSTWRFEVHVHPEVAR